MSQLLPYMNIMYLCQRIHHRINVPTWSCDLRQMLRCDVCHVTTYVRCWGVTSVTWRHTSGVGVWRLSRDDIRQVLRCDVCHVTTYDRYWRVTSRDDIRHKIKCVNCGLKESNKIEVVMSWNFHKYDSRFLLIMQWAVYQLWSQREHIGKIRYILEHF